MVFACGTDGRRHACYTKRRPERVAGHTACDAASLGVGLRAIAMPPPVPDSTHEPGAIRRTHRRVVAGCRDVSSLVAAPCRRPVVGGSLLPSMQPEYHAVVTGIEQRQEWRCASIGQEKGDDLW